LAIHTSLLYGLLEQARKTLGNVLEGFYTSLPDKSQIVVLEPSCLSVFKDELLRMYPDDQRAQAMATRCVPLSQLLDSSAIKLARTMDHGIVHLHCHDKSLGMDEHERRWLKACFTKLNEVESGCCGMAGTYGMRKQTRSIGQTLFQRALAPAIEHSRSSTVIVANGFSCHEQIAGSTGRRVLHPVEVLEACL